MNWILDGWIMVPGCIWRILVGGGVNDPLSDLFESWSPYTYGYDNPVRFVDPTGMENEDRTKNDDDRDNAERSRKAYEKDGKYHLDIFYGPPGSGDNNTGSSSTVAGCLCLGGFEGFGKGAQQERPGDDLIKRYENNERMGWAFQFTAELLLELGVGGDYISKARELLIESGVFNPDDKGKKLMEVHSTMVEVLTKFKETIPGSKLAESYITGSALIFFVQGANYHRINENNLAPKIKEANPAYYDKNIEPFLPRGSGGAGAKGGW